MSLLSDLRAAREVYQLFRELKPDIVHTHNPKPGVYGRIAAKLARVPAIVNTVHGLYAQPTDRFARRAAVYSLERVAAAFSNAELVQNPEDVATLRRLRVPAKKLAVLGNGIDLDRFTPATKQSRDAIRRKLGISDETIVVGAVGRLVEEKGYVELFDAFRSVRAVIPNAQLMVIGPHQPGKADALGPDIMAAAEADGVRFLGHRDDVETLYPAMDIYVLASHREGFPRSAMEAAACGLPLVLTNIRGCRQVVDDGTTGLLVPVRDSTALGQALVTLCGDAEQRAQMRTAGLQKAHDDFDQQHVIDITCGTYARLLETRPKHTLPAD
jgi:glycosyltransferase involved in cell wall biosynthesis